jgi:cytochrome c oxidase cbb3-type subunit 2
MKIFDDHRILFCSAAGLFLGLTLFVAIIPALNNQANNAPLPNSTPLSADAARGKALYIANGCVACHTQQVRNVAMDKIWGSRPSISADYAANRRTDLWRNTATLMGTERTGPDLTNIGQRQPSVEWHLLHLYNPRAVVEPSIMPAYPWLFEQKSKAAPGEKVINVPDRFRTDSGTGVIVARPEALQLVAYLLSLKQTALPASVPEPGFLYIREKAPATGGGLDADIASGGLDGGALYATNCQACHQANGEGLKGAFPSLKGSAIVTDENPERLIKVIMNGYSGRVSEGFPVMPPIGAINKLKPEEIRAIINHERSSWGNKARAATLDEVKAAMKGN